MSYWQAVWLGIVQGVTEFLPVSSSGHLALFSMITGRETPGGLTFDIMLHIGTLFAVFIAFWGDIKSIISAFFAMLADLFFGRRSLTDPDVRRMILLLGIALIPLFMLILFRDFADRTRSPLIIGMALIVTGCLLKISDYYQNGTRNERTTKKRDALLVGWMQACAALIPGLSRSGSTISTGLFRGMSREFAFKFSFLLSIPTIMAATAFELASLLREPPANPDHTLANIWMQGLIGIAVAAFVGYLAIVLLRRLMRGKGFGAFAYYCWVVGGLVIGAVLLGYLNAL